MRAAVYTGADAVYLGGKAFGARAAAQNFDSGQLLDAVRFCHGRSVRVYITVNTLLKDRELPQALSFIDYLCGLGVDAVIVQDLGLYRAIRACAPELKIHASTQMSIHNTAGARLLEFMGIKRAVLARELSEEEIRSIACGTSLELEVFVHGAQCMSVSGQCYFSALLGSRSGNRGMCAQPCRLPFTADGGTGYDLSLKDLTLVDKLKRLAEAGVTSAKIEGRMKRPEYVAAAVNACVTVNRGEALPPEEWDKLSAVFSRSGFTDGYFTGNLGRDMFGIRTKEDVSGTTQKVLAGFRTLYRKETQRVPVSFTLQQNKAEVSLSVFDFEGNSAEVSLQINHAANQETILSKERCRQQLAKTGGTPFYIQQSQIPDTGISLTISTLNRLRRQVLEQLLEKREATKPIAFYRRDSRDLLKADENKDQAGKTDKLPLWGAFRTLEQIPSNAHELKRVLLPIGLGVTAVEAAEMDPLRTVMELPRAFFGSKAEQELILGMESFMKAGFRCFSCGNLGALALCRELGATPYGTFGLNITNSSALRFFAELGLAGTELSFELKKEEISEIGAGIPKGYMIYGRQALMLVRNCPIKNGSNCRSCQGFPCLTDRKRIAFPVGCTGGRKTGYSEIYNSLPLYLADQELTGCGVDFGILRFTVETSVETESVLSACMQREKPDFNYTRGLFHRGIF